MDSFTSRKNILILLSPTLNPNLLFSVVALGTLLVKAGKSVSILLENKEKLGSNGNLLDKIIRDRKIVSINLIDRIQSKKTLITVNKGNSKIKNVQWKEDGEKLMFQIESVSDNFEISDVDFKTTGTEADAVIFIGCKEINDLSYLYSTNPNLFTSSFSINLDNSKDNLRFAKSNLVLVGEAFTKVFINFVKDNSLTLSSSEATLFLQSLLLETKLFTLGIDKSESTFETVLDLIKSGANYTEALNNYNSITGSERKIPVSVTPVKPPVQQYVQNPKPIQPIYPAMKNPVNMGVKPTPNVVLPPKPTLTSDQVTSVDKMFPKAGTTNEPSAIKVDQTQSNTPLFSPYSQPSYTPRPVNKGYQGFMPNPGQVAGGNKTK
ncbi:MAG: hypothetical protein WCO33_02665 [bacterium]